MRQRKAFYRQGIPESICARRETADIDILETSMNGDRKTMQSIRIRTSSLKQTSKWTFYGIYCTCQFSW